MLFFLNPYGKNVLFLIKLFLFQSFCLLHFFIICLFYSGCSSIPSSGDSRYSVSLETNIEATPLPW